MRAIRDDWAADEISRDCGTPINALNEAIAALESLTLQEQEKTIQILINEAKNIGLYELRVKDNSGSKESTMQILTKSLKLKAIRYQTLRFGDYRPQKPLTRAIERTKKSSE